MKERPSNLSTSINPKTRYANRVKAGIKVYDQLDPDWWTKIDETRFDMSTVNRCL